MIWNVYLKELKDAFRDRKTIFLSIIIPILFNIGIVFFIDNYIQSDKEGDSISVSINEHTDTEIINWFKGIKQLDINLSDDPLHEVKEGKAVVAIDVKEGANQVPDITVYSEPTSSKGSSATDMILGLLSSKKNEQIIEKLGEANVSSSIMEPFTFKQQSVTGEKDTMSKYMISIMAQLVIVLGVLMGGLPASSDLFAGEKERKTMEALMMTPVKRIHILVGKWFTIATLGMISGIFSVLTLVAFVQLFTSNMKEALQLDQHIATFISSLAVGIIVFAFLVSALQMVLSMAANTMKEAQNYVSPVMMVSMIPYFLLIGITPNEFQPYHFIIPFMNIYALIKQLIYGIYDLNSILLVAGSSIIFIAITFTIASLMFQKSKWVLGKS